MLFPLSVDFNVTPAGDVGIGTSTPTTKLDVVGTLTLNPPDDRALDIKTGSIYKGGALFIHNKGGVYGGSTALGLRALANPSDGEFNTAFGREALQDNTTGCYNTATGAVALWNNTTGTYNTASGFSALAANMTGCYNTASGSGALWNNTTGGSNTASGLGALRSNTTGSGNIGIGVNAGSNLTTGNNNIAIGNIGVAGESGTIRIGRPSHTRTFIAGIRGVTTDVSDAIPVMIDSAGQLGTIPSSRRFKENIHDMADTTERLLDLRPVLFRYKKRNTDGNGPQEYGLIAEEVAEVFPDLVVYDGEGKPFTVKYHLLSSMLLNELQKQVERAEAQVRQQHERDEAQERELAQMRAVAGEFGELKARLAALESLAAQASTPAAEPSGSR